MAKPYINLDRGIARAEPSRLLTEKDRRVAEDVRNVGNQQEKMGKKKVCSVCRSHLLYQSPMRNSYPSYLEAEKLVPFWKSSLYL